MQMCKRKPLIRTLVLMLCVLLIGNSAISMAVTDVTSGHWANAQIGRVIDNKLMPTYAMVHFNLMLWLQALKL